MLVRLCVFVRFVIISMSLLLTTIIYADGYYPPKGDWQRKAPAELGLNKAKLNKAVQYANDHEYTGSRDLRRAILKGFEREPFHKILGPTKKRGGPAGLIIRNGYIAAEWGDLNRVDMTFSVTKSYLTTVAGLAIDAGLITSTDDKLSDYIWTGEFAGRHNSKITWEHLLNQSSDWSGELFGIKDWADRPPREGDIDDWKNRELKEPGTVMEYNDVRVNLLTYSLLHVWRKPLPQVLKEAIMDPINASTTWRWFGYNNAWVTIDGMQMKSVTGGGHSGGGMFVSTYDQARFGLLFLRQGKWGEKQLISKEWIKQATTPSKPNSGYGYMWWLNRDKRQWPDVEDDSIFVAAGFGGNYIVVDQANELLIITRWLEPKHLGEFVKLVRESL